MGTLNFVADSFATSFRIPIPLRNVSEAGGWDPIKYSPSEQSERGERVTPWQGGSF